MKYVVGFRMDPLGKRVVLVSKMKPAWQRGRLNGVGGKIERGETARQAIIREFREETGVHIEDWEQTVVLTGKTFEVTFFRSFGYIDAVRTETDEEIIIHNVEDLFALSVIPNLKWLIPMQLDNTISWPVHIKDIAASEDDHVGN